MGILIFFFRFNFIHLSWLIDLIGFAEVWIRARRRRRCTRARARRTRPNWSSGPTRPITKSTASWICATITATATQIRPWAVARHNSTDSNNTANSSTDSSRNSAALPLRRCLRFLPMHRRCPRRNCKRNSAMPRMYFNSINLVFFSIYNSLLSEQLLVNSIIC